MDDKEAKIVCECGWRGNAGQLLEGQNPFAPHLTIYGCPNCKEIEQFAPVCDADGCWSTHISGGMPTPEGYKHLCSTHYGEESNRQNRKTMEALTKREQ